MVPYYSYDQDGNLVAPSNGGAAGSRAYLDPTTFFSGVPAINVVIQTRALVWYGLLSREERRWLNEIYDYNPLLFDFAVKRTIHHPESGNRFPASVFTGADLGPPFRPPSR